MRYICPRNILFKRVRSGDCSLWVSLNEQRKARGGEGCVYLVGGGVVAPSRLRQRLVIELQTGWLRIHSSYDFIGTNGGRSTYDAQSGRGGLKGCAGTIRQGEGGSVAGFAWVGFPDQGA